MKKRNEIEIHLKTVPQNKRIVPNNFKNTLKVEFATKYLESIDAYPTKDNIDFVLQKIPIDKTFISTNWAREIVSIDPIRSSSSKLKIEKNEEKPSIHKISPTMPSLILKKTNKRSNLTTTASSNELTTETYTSTSTTTSTQILTETKKDIKSLRTQTKNSSRSRDPLELSGPLLRIIKYSRNAAESFKSILVPPDFDQEDIMDPIHSFIGSIGEFVPSLKTDKSGEIFKFVRKILTEPGTIRLMGLLVHFCYWNLIHPFARKAIITGKKSIYGKNAIIGEVFEEVDLNPSSHIKQRMHYPDIIKQSKADKQIIQQEIVEFHAFENPEDELSLSTVVMNNDIDGFSLASDDGTAATEKSLTIIEKEQLFVQVEHCLISIFRQLGRSKKSLVLGRSSLVSCCHYVVDDILTSIYPWFAAVSDAPWEEQKQIEEKFSDNIMLIDAMKELNGKLRKLVHLGIADLTDPTGMYVSVDLMGSFIGKSNRKRLESKSKTNYYATSTAIKAVFGDSNSDSMKRLFNKDKELSIKLPGVGKSFSAPTPENYPDLSEDSSKKLDFNRLFENQPDVDYYPHDPRYSNVTTEEENINNDGEKDEKVIYRNGLEKIKPNDLMLRASTSIPRSRPRPFQFKNVELSDDPIRPSSSIVKRRFKGDSPHYRMTTMERSQDTHRPSITMSMQQNVVINRHTPFKSSENNAVSTGLGIHNQGLFDGESNASIGSKSLVINHNSEMPITLRGKTKLMHMIVDKSKEYYMKQIQTRKTRSRVNLLEGI